MTTHYSLDIQQSANYPKLVQANKVLAQAIGPQSAPLVTVEWTKLDDLSDRPLYRLKLKEVTVAEPVFADFSLDEFDNQLLMHFRMYRLWGDMLQKRQEYQHRIVQQLHQELYSSLEGV